MSKNKNMSTIYMLSKVFVLSFLAFLFTIVLSCEVQSAEANSDASTNNTGTTVPSTIYGSTIQAAGRIATNGAVEGVLGSGFASNYFKIYTHAAGIFSIESKGTLSIKGSLLDSAGNEILTADSGTSTDGINFKIEKELKAGTYYLQVEGVDTSVVGTYELDVAFQKDDHGNEQANASAISFDARMQSSSPSELEYEGDIDYYSVVVPAGAELTIESTGVLDTLGYLYDDTGTELTNDNNSGDADNFKITQTLNTGGTYYIKLEANASNMNLIQTGSYSLELSITDDYGNDLSTARTVSTTSTTAGALQYAGDAEYFQFQSKNGYITITTSDTSQSYMYVYDDEGQLLLSDENNTQTNTDSLTKYLNAGKYYLEVKGISESARGNYSVKMTLAEDDGGDEKENAVSIASSGNRTVNIEEAGDIDFFSFEVADTGLLQIETTGTLDPKIVLYDENATEITNDDNSGSNNNVKISRTLNAGTYYIQLQENDATVTGEYQLLMSFWLGTGSLDVSKKLEGYVTANLGGSGVSGSTVSIQSLDGATRYASTITAEDGYFSINSIEGEYAIVAEKQGRATSKVVTYIDDNTPLLSMQQFQIQYAGMSLSPPEIKVTGLSNNQYITANTTVNYSVTASNSLLVTSKRYSFAISVNSIYGSDKIILLLMGYPPPVGMVDKRFPIVTEYIEAISNEISERSFLLKPYQIPSGRAYIEFVSYDNNDNQSKRIIPVNNPNPENNDMSIDSPGTDGGSTVEIFSKTLAKSDHFYSLSPNTTAYITITVPASNNDGLMVFRGKDPNNVKNIGSVSLDNDDGNFVFTDASPDLVEKQIYVYKLKYYKLDSNDNKVYTSDFSSPFYVPILPHLDFGLVAPENKAVIKSPSSIEFSVKLSTKFDFITSIPNYASHPLIKTTLFTVKEAGEREKLFSTSSGTSRLEGDDEIFYYLFDVRNTTTPLTGKYFNWYVEGSVQYEATSSTYNNVYSIQAVTYPSGSDVDTILQGGVYSFSVTQ